MKKYGGLGRMRQTCKKRRCLNIEKENANEESTEKQVEKSEYRKHPEMKN